MSKFATCFNGHSLAGHLYACKYDTYTFINSKEFIMPNRIDEDILDKWEQEDLTAQMEENDTVICDVCGKEVKRSFTVENEYIELCRNCFKG
jgi:ribosome-binding protein aMBF1 (putative translation factor)